MILSRLAKDCQGASGLMVAGSIVVIFGFAVLAIDASIIMLAKSQLQNAADAAAIAGALEYTLTDGDQEAATNEAIYYAGLNVAILNRESPLAPVTINAGDVTFPESNKITVVTHRTRETGDAVQIYFLKVLDPLSDNLGNVKARASASVFPVVGSDCLKPWCFPDRWEDTNANEAYDAGEFYDPDLTGYRAPDDIGDQITLRLQNSNNSPRMGWYYCVDFAPINTGDPVITGADAYREWIPGCEPYMVTEGDQLQVEPGNMVGPTIQGIDDLISLDPNAVWEAGSGTVVNSDFPTSPRVVKCAVFDPTVGVQTDVNGRDYVTITKIVVVFVEGNNGSAVYGRFMRRSSDGDICPECPNNSFLFRAVLVE